MNRPSIPFQDVLYSPGSFPSELVNLGAIGPDEAIPPESRIAHLNLPG